MIFLRSISCLFLFLISTTIVFSQISDAEVLIENAGSINSTNLEFSPTFYENGIVYATSKYNSGKRDEKIDETFFELFYAEYDSEGSLFNAKPFSININSQLHEGPVTFSRDYQTIYFTRNNLKKGLRKADSKGVTRLKIYEGKKGNEDWEDIVELPFNDDEYSVAHPTLAANGTSLYFASDMPGGQGGMDLYMVTKTDAGWGNPINLGPTVNTTANEVFPFIHSSGTLFFSSNGHDTTGGLDLYMAKGVDADWREVENLGPKFNSGSDDLGLILNPDGRSGYFASNRGGGTGKDDIYFFQVDDGVAGATKPTMIDVTMKVYDKRTTAAIEGAFIRIFENTPEGYMSGGKSLYDAVLMPSADDANDLTFKLVRKDNKSLGNPDGISNSNGEAGYAFTGEKSFLIIVTKDGYDSAEFKYETIGNVGASEIEVPMVKSICLDLKGTVNDKTSNARIPNAVVSIWNSCDGTDTQIQANVNGEFEYCLKQGCEFLIKGFKESYNTEYERLTTNAEEVGAKSVNLFLAPISVASAPIRTFEKGSVIVLENIYYDFNKSYIRAGAARELDELYNLLSQHPTMKIELISHTDSRGSNSYNNKLSQKRAESAKQFLVKKGISRDRINAIGLGESQPRVRCSNCSEAQHQNNRRTEVRIIQVRESIQIEYQNNDPEVIDRKRN